MPAGVSKARSARPTLVVHFLSSRSPVGLPKDADERGASGAVKKCGVQQMCLCRIRNKVGGSSACSVSVRLVHLHITPSFLVKPGGGIE
jgi:hypothetical protein